MGPIAMLKPQDLLITLKLAALHAKSDLRETAVEQWIAQLQSSRQSRVEDSVREIDLDPASDWSYRSISEATGISLAEVSAAIKRAIKSNLLIKLDEKSRPIPVRQSLHEFIEHGVRYVYPAERGAPVRGIPTAFASALFDGKISATNELPPVWRYAAGSTSGYALSPIYKSAPAAAAKDPMLYELLVLVDVFRIGREREKSIARELLKERLS
ncbi:MAG: hypothetical protein AB8G17_05960 [Gammaproteobacteria bacterium]